MHNFKMIYELIIVIFSLIILSMLIGFVITSVAEWVGNNRNRYYLKQFRIDDKAGKKYLYIFEIPKKTFKVLKIITGDDWEYSLYTSDKKHIK